MPFSESGHSREQELRPKEQLTFSFKQGRNDPGATWTMNVNGKPDFQFFFGAGKATQALGEDNLLELFPEVFSKEEGRFKIDSNAAWDKILENPDQKAMQELASRTGISIKVEQTGKHRGDVLKNFEFNPEAEKK